MTIDVVFAFNGFIFSSFVLFFIIKNIGFKKNHLLFLLAFLFNINLYMLFTLLSRLVSSYTHNLLTFSPIPLYFLSGPFIYLYTYSIIHNNHLPNGVYKHFLITLLHFIPLISLCFPSTLQLVIFNKYEQVTFICALPFFMAYTLAAIHKSNTFKKKWKSKKLYFLSAQANWLRSLLLVLIGISSLLYLIVILLLFNAITPYIYNTLNLALRNLLLFWLAYQGVFLPLIKKELRVILFFEKEYEKLSNIDSNTLSRKFEELLIKKKAYLNPDINIEKVALDVGVFSRDISYYCNTFLGVKFRDYINRLRVEAMLAYLKDYPHERYKVVWLANKFGFKSSLTAQRAFKKNTGKTIGDYLSSPQKN